MKVIGFEGFLQGKKSVVWELLNEAAKVNEFEFYTFAYSEKVKVSGQVIWVGHSFGGEAALRHARYGDKVLTIDPRPYSNPIGCLFDSFFRFEMPFKAPYGSDTFNFFRRGVFLPGQRVLGATQNWELPKSIGHMEMPFEQVVLSTLAGLVRREI